MQDHQESVGLSCRLTGRKVAGLVGTVGLSCCCLEGMVDSRRVPAVGSLRGRVGSLLDRVGRTASVGRTSLFFVTCEIERKLIV